MNTHAAPGSMRDALYEAPGPRTKRKVAIGTGISAVVVVALIALIVRQFAVTGQLASRYWSFFLDPDRPPVCRHGAARLALLVVLPRMDHLALLAPGVCRYH